MKCKICGCDKTKIIYKDLIRDGEVGKYTKEPVEIWQCQNCNVIWHDVLQDIGQYYESEDYRNALEGSSKEEHFYKLHDKETLDKFQYTGTEIFRQKVIADIGCGCGAFLDFLKGVARTIIAVEPSKTYRAIMERKGFYTFAYAKEALESYKGKIDVIVSFDVIEHVKRPDTFLSDIFELLNQGGQAVIGTPTDAPIMRTLLGKIYEQKLLFSTQHLWIFSEQGLRLLAQKAGFIKIDIKYFQRYGIGNMMGWIKDKTQGTPVKSEFITSTLDHVWRSQCSDQKMADYIVLYLEK